MRLPRTKLRLHFEGDYYFKYCLTPRLLFEGDSYPRATTNQVNMVVAKQEFAQAKYSATRLNQPVLHEESHRI